jgi:hypothetical protein
MSALTGPALVAAALLVVAGAAKVADPRATAGALRELRLPSSLVGVRIGAAAEATLGALALVVGGAVWWLAIAVSYLAFAVFVGAALRAGTMVGSCGCFGHEDTPPHPLHMALNLVLAGVTVAAAVDGAAPLVDALDGGGTGIAVLAVSIAALRVLYAGYVDVPRALARARRDQPPADG